MLCDMHAELATGDNVYVILGVLKIDVYESIELNLVFLGGVGITRDNINDWIRIVCYHVL